MALSGLDDPDDELLRRVVAGDDDAYAIFYRRHLDGVLAFLRRRVAQPELAFDLAAETFAAVILAAPDRRSEGAPAAWLYGIARNKLRESLRRGRVEDAARRRLGLEPIDLHDADLRRVEERAEAGALQLAAMLEELPEPIRRALVARVVDEREYPDIATELACSEQVVRQRVHRGLRALRTKLEESA
jgi:RNA polymerase sigma-70 factor (ECF subfamily)